MNIKMPANTSLEIGDLGLLKTIHPELGWPVVVQSLSRVQLFLTPWTTARQALLSFHYLLEVAQIHVY